VSDAWMPGAGRKPAAADGGPLQGGAPRAVWQSLGTDPRVVSARSAAQRLGQLGRSSHLVWNPLNGEIIQLIPIVRAARSLGCPEGLEHAGPPGPEEAGTIAGPADRAAAAQADGSLAAVNAEGRLCVQICVVAFAWEPFTSGPMAGLPGIVRWLDSWGIPRQWPAGPPAPFPHGHAGCCSRRLWAMGGHFGASQVPGWTAAGPGSVDVDLLTGRAALPAAGLPRARPSSTGSAQGTDRTDSAPARRPAAALPDLDGIFQADAPAAASLTRVS
jgi:hypothetical protein